MGATMSALARSAIDVLLLILARFGAPREGQISSTGRRARRSVVLEHGLSPIYTFTPPETNMAPSGFLDHAEEAQRQSAGPTLNMDVVDYIMPLLSREDLLSVMRICKDAQLLGLRYLLKMRIVVHPEHLGTFCDCLMQEPSIRCSWLRRLVLRTPRHEDNFDLRLVTRLTAVLEHAYLLEELELHIAQSILDTYPTLARTLAALGHLSALHMGGYCLNQGAAMIVTQIPSALTQLHTVFDPILDPQDAHQVLGPFAASLVDVCLSNVVFRQTADARRYPKVQMLDIDFNAVQCNIDVLMRLFPCLVHLWLRGVAKQAGQTVQTIRDSNMNAQAQQRWPSLGFLGGRATTLYAAGLLCPVERLDVTFSDSETWEDVANLIPIVENAHPHTLTAKSHYLHSSLIETFWTCSQHVTILTMIIVLDEETKESWEQIAERALCLVEPFEVVCSIDIFFTVQAPTIPLWDFDLYATEDEWYAARERGAEALRQFNAEHFALWIAERVPSTVHICLNIPNNSESKWMVERVGNKSVLVKKS
ncbi:hypothetical protein CERSUDRAFT_127435 [Gelatoporia subvermispora B]|uniref:F-box domain-containing protein n=1 Tax=Ceriporiopsis subvermispora (strain B) TaxID=914234 RepID=M2QY45_CERS8|nr:hypothetical protein CERSUDRAFT_127435 [Gelatoporia subvermispora B]